MFFSSEDLSVIDVGFNPMGLGALYLRQSRFGQYAGHATNLWRLRGHVFYGPAWEAVGWKFIRPHWVKDLMHEFKDFLPFPSQKIVTETAGGRGDTGVSEV